MQILLASSSPRRYALLQQLGLSCRVETPEVDENALMAAALGAVPGPSLEAAQHVARTLARAKADAVAQRLTAEAADVLVVAADTIVVCDGALLNKPADADDARRMLAALSGRSHQVVTGVALRHIAGGTAARDDAHSGVETTAVTFRTLSPACIDAYVSSGEPLDKAGAYGIQGLGASLVRRIEGCYFNVVGLPLSLLTDMMDALGVPVHTFWSRSEV